MGYFQARRVSNDCISKHQQDLGQHAVSLPTVFNKLQSRTRMAAVIKARALIGQAFMTVGKRGWCWCRHFQQMTRRKKGRFVKRWQSVVLGSRPVTRATRVFVLRGARSVSPPAPGSSVPCPLRCNGVHPQRPQQRRPAERVAGANRYRAVY